MTVKYPVLALTPGYTYELVRCTPNILSSNINNWNPNDPTTFVLWVDCDVLRLTTNASRTITGFVASPLRPRKRIFNIGSNDFVLSHQDALSLAANRINTKTGASVTISGGGCVDLEYDPISTFWRQV